MTRQLIDIAKECGAFEWYNPSNETIVPDNGDIVFNSWDEVQAAINAVNAQNGEPVYQYLSGDGWKDCTKERYDDRTSSKRIVYLAPQTLPPEWAEYVGRLEGAFTVIGEKTNTIRMKYNTGSGIDNRLEQIENLIMDVINSKPKG